MEDIEEIEKIIETSDELVLNSSKQVQYLRAIVKIQLLILKELRKQ